jgi:hypothetical protein
MGRVVPTEAVLGAVDLDGPSAEDDGAVAQMERDGTPTSKVVMPLRKTPAPMARVTSGTRDRAYAAPALGGRYPAGTQHRGREFHAFGHWGFAQFAAVAERPGQPCR